MKIKIYNLIIYGINRTKKKFYNKYQYMQNVDFQCYADDLDMISGIQNSSIIPKQDQQMVREKKDVY